MPAALNRLDDLMPEKAVLEKWPGLFTEDELRNARQTGAVEWYAMRNKAYYTEQQLLEYLETRKRTCQSARPLIQSDLEPDQQSGHDLKLAGNGSGMKRREAFTIVTGMSPESAAASAAEALGQEI